MPLAISTKLLRAAKSLKFYLTSDVQYERRSYNTSCVNAQELLLKAKVVSATLALQLLYANLILIF